jgi:hypothetical protein
MALWYHRVSVIAWVVGCCCWRGGQRQSRTVRDSQGQSGTVRDSQGQSGTVRDSQGQSGTVRDSRLDCPRLSLTVPDCDTTLSATVLDCDTTLSAAFACWIAKKNETSSDQHA